VSCSPAAANTIFVLTELVNACRKTGQIKNLKLKIFLFFDMWLGAE